MKKLFFILSLTLATFAFAVETPEDYIQTDSIDYNFEMQVDSIQTDSIIAVENVESETVTEKFYLNGQIFIKKQGIVYTVNGAIAK